MLHYIGSCIVKIIKMKMGEGRQEVRRKKGGVGDAGDKKEEAERVPLTLALTPVTPGG